MRSWLLAATWVATYSILAATVFVANAAASGPSPMLSPETHDIRVTPTGFEPPEIQIKKGDIVRWVTDAGSFIIIDGDPTDELPDGAIFQIALDATHKSGEHLFGETGIFSFFAQGNESTMRGTITVKEAVSPVNIATWGKIKALFEGP